MRATARERFRKAIETAGLSAQKLADDFGKAGNYFQRGDDTFPADADSAQYIAARTGFRAAWLLFGELPEKADADAQEALRSAYASGRASALKEVAFAALRAADGRQGTIGEDPASPPVLPTPRATDAHDGVRSAVGEAEGPPPVERRTGQRNRRRG